MKNILPLLALLGLSLTGCQTASGPSVSLVNLHFNEATAFETTATFTVRIVNETPDPLQLTGGSYKIYLNGLYVGQGLSGDSVTVPRLGTATQNVTVHLNNIRMLTRIRPLIESRSFDYRIKSTLYGQSGGSMRSENEGRLDLNDFTPTPPAGPVR